MTISTNYHNKSHSTPNSGDYIPQTTSSQTGSRITAIDKRVAQNLRQFRVMRGISQKRLAEELGVSFQQIQKYENGTNRLSVGKMAAVASFMEIPYKNFFAETAENMILARSIDQSPDDPASSEDQTYELADIDIRIAILASKLPAPQKQQILELLKTLVHDD